MRLMTQRKLRALLITLSSASAFSPAVDVWRGSCRLASWETPQHRWHLSAMPAIGRSCSRCLSQGASGRRQAAANGVLRICSQLPSFQKSQDDMPLERGWAPNPNGRSPDEEDVMREDMDDSVNMVVKMQGEPEEILQKLAEAGLLETVVVDTVCCMLICSLITKRLMRCQACLA